MFGMQTNMFVHVYILPHHQSFPHSPSTYHTLPLWLRQMPPKSKPNTHSGIAQTLPDSCKHQGSNADQPKTKRTQHKTIEANDNDKNKSGSEQEAADGVEDEDDPPVLRGSRQGRVVKKGPPRRYIRHNHCQSCPNFFVFCFHDYLLLLQENCPQLGSRQHGTVPTKVCWARLLRSCPYFFLFFFLFRLLT